MAKNVTLKNTKQEIYDALTASLEREKELKERNFNPAVEAKEKEDMAIVESAEKSVKENLFSEELSKKFADLEAAIEIKSAELQEMYGIEKELQNITVAVNAGKELSAKIELEKTAKKAELAELTESLQKEYEKKTKELSDSHDVYCADLVKQRKREIEEYEYNLKRSREKENDEWEDVKAEREADIQARESKAQAMFEEAETKVAYIAELEEKVNSIPELIEKAKAEGAEAASKEDAREYGYKKTMAEKEFGYEKQRLEDKVESLSAELSKVLSANVALEEKLDNAYAQIRELATKTVESTGGVKILGNANNDTRK